MLMLLSQRVLSINVHIWYALFRLKLIVSATVYRNEKKE
ncbi:hypothetical protein PITCH_A1260022 [uncultured Desulfobacterium sp.]|uniref:Uncharacterized protein n=1 Tax=uncultured Desulfobacterium sp. TaxID=201089 RepID=A0A445MRY7_9BACT|nr:hypothetical protein PITCH_A1260022 [uncultured Desulfobacterium sp.]